MMANPCRKERLGFSKFRSRQQAAKDRRFCITWISRMVNKQVEKRITELRLEFFLMSLDLFEMVDENHAQWLEAMVQVLRESSLHHTTVDRELKTSSWRRQMGEGNSEEDDAEPPGRGTKRVLVKKMVLKTFSDLFADGDNSESETSDVSPDGDISDSKTSSSEIIDVSPYGDVSDSKTSSSETSSSEIIDVSPDSDATDSKTSSSETSSSEISDGSTDGDTSDSKTSSSETSSSEIIDVSPDGDASDSKTSSSETSDGSPDSDTSDSKTSGSETSGCETSGCETSDVSPGGDTSSKPAESDQQENQTGASKLMKKNEEKISKNPFHQNPGSMTSRGEEARVLLNNTNEEEALLTEREWKEWLDEQEMRGNVKPVDQQNAEEQGGAAPPTPEKETKKERNVKGAVTVKKIKSYLGDLFSPPMNHKWERFEDDD